MTNTCFRSPARKLHPGLARTVASVLCLATGSPGVRPGHHRTRPARGDRAPRRTAVRRRQGRGEANQTRPTVPPLPPGTSVDLTLQEATTRALERNLELAVERLNPQTFDLNIARILAGYRPTLTSQFGQRAVVQAPTNQLNGGTIVQNDTTTYNAGIVQSLKWGGGNFAFQFNNNKQVTSNIFANFNPTFTSNFNLAVTQPLLRGFSIDVNRQQLRVTAINRDISEIQLRGTIATTLAFVRNCVLRTALRDRGDRGRPRLPRPGRKARGRQPRARGDRDDGAAGRRAGGSGGGHPPADRGDRPRRRGGRLSSRSSGSSSMVPMIRSGEPR